MRLESIKLAGFKSFVDPTLITFPGNLNAIVGPNGCGKSNIIDAIRWVMGESSAKQLRGQSLEDVIFNGSKTRNPLGKASIELNFDNSAERFGGPYRHYAQITIRREITREGQSIYLVNEVRCRRRDIRDIFLGTGLGSCHYAIIEQGMISRIIDAKPDELRTYIEEAAGLSKYKEQRRETELRLERVQENLNRLNGLREELGKQCNHLKKQAHLTQCYKKLKQEERFTKAALSALRYQRIEEKLKIQLAQLKTEENKVHRSQLAQQKLIKKMEESRIQQANTKSEHDTAQAQYYKLCHEITYLEEKQCTESNKQKHCLSEQKTLSQKKANLLLQLQANETKQAQLSRSIEEFAQKKEQLQLDLIKKKTELEEISLDFNCCLEKWDKAQSDFNTLTQEKRLLLAESQSLQQQSTLLKERIESLNQERKEQNYYLNNNPQENLEKDIVPPQKKQQNYQRRLTQITQQIHELRIQLKAKRKILDHLKVRLQKIQGELMFFMNLRQENLETQDQNFLNWLEQHRLTKQPRLAQLLKIEPGWERAVEIALKQHLQAICILDQNLPINFLKEVPSSPFSLIKPPKNSSRFPANSSQITLPLLSTKLTAPWPLEHLLVGIYVAETTLEALKQTEQLAGRELIITREGLCFGAHWIYFAPFQSLNSLERDAKIVLLKNRQKEIGKQLSNEEVYYKQYQHQLEALEKQQVLQQKEFLRETKYQMMLEVRQKEKRRQVTQAKLRSKTIHQELKRLEEQYDLLHKKLQGVDQKQRKIDYQIKPIEKQLFLLSKNKPILQTKQDGLKKAVTIYENKLHTYDLQFQTIQHALKTEDLLRVNLNQQQIDIEHQLHTSKDILEEIQFTIENLEKEHLIKTEKKNKLNIYLKAKLEKIEALQKQVQHAEQQSYLLQDTLLLEQKKLEEQRLFIQELRIRGQTLEEQLKEQGYTIEPLLSKILLEKKKKDAFEKRLVDITRGIEQIGAINLGALEEYQTVLDKKKYLDTQHNDLNKALKILQTAIEKIEEETRKRFKETFNKIQEHFANLFPLLFPGGMASLQLYDPNLSTSGICIMAQPSGKRNSTLYLLSGGEKALTAIAFIFSLFQLNPAPFCLLDEVDAPLDEANVHKFCRLVKKISREVQLIFISHNKVTIEMAQYLIGITMNEPGISRMVNVDLEKIMAIAPT